MGNCRSFLSLSLPPPSSRSPKDLIRFANGIKYSHLPIDQQHVIIKSIIDAIKRNQQEYERQRAKEIVIIDHRCIVRPPPTPVDTRSIFYSLPLPKAADVKAEKDARRRAYNMIFAKHTKN